MTLEISMAIHPAFPKPPPRHLEFLRETMKYAYPRSFPLRSDFHKEILKYASPMRLTIPFDGQVMVKFPSKYSEFQYLWTLRNSFHVVRY